MNRIIVIIFRFVGVILFQVLILNNVFLFGVATPYVYPLAILLMPFETPRSLLLLIAMVTGLILDAFTGTGGMHTFALVFMAYSRPVAINYLMPREGYHPDSKPTIDSMGIVWVLLYTSILLLVFHLIFCTIEVMSFKYVAYLFMRITTSTITAVLIVLLLQFMVYPIRKKRMS
jgi:rod shape-determining protein MreD